MTVEQLLAEVVSTAEEMAGLIERLPAEAVHRRGAPGEWTVAEIGGHAAEFPVFQATQARRIAEAPGLRFGRQEGDADRLAAAARFGGAAPGEIALAVRGAAGEAVEILRRIPEDGWDAVGENISLGRMTAREVVEVNVVKHMRGHLAQARAVVG